MMAILTDTNDANDDNYIYIYKDGNLPFDGNLESTRSI